MPYISCVCSTTLALQWLCSMSSDVMVQAQHQEAVSKETTSRNRVRIMVIPMILYFTFILAACFYFYARIEYGMGGLTPPLRSYSFFVLFVEMLGSVNMLFYACWLFARPVNTDVFPPVNEDGEPLFCCTFSTQIHAAVWMMCEPRGSFCRRDAPTAAQVHCASAHPLLQRVPGYHPANCACRPPR